MELNLDNYRIGSEITLDDTPINDLKYQSYQDVERPEIYNRFNWFRDIPQFSMNIPVNSKQKVSSNQMVQFFVNKGLTYNQSRGLVGNLLHESGGGIYNIVQGGKQGELKIDGKTGYEQYYTDINSFWRDLYTPVMRHCNSFFNEYFQLLIQEQLGNRFLKTKF